MKVPILIISRIEFQKDFRSLKHQSVLDLFGLDENAQSQYLSPQNLLSQTGQTDLDQELEAYGRQFADFLQLWTELDYSQTSTTWNGDPDLNVNVELGHFGEQRQDNTSFIVKGMRVSDNLGLEVSQLALEVSITEEQILEPTDSGIILALVNLSELNEVLDRVKDGKIDATMLQSSFKENLIYIKHIKRHHFQLIDIDSDVYELIIIDRLAEKISTEGQAVKKDIKKLINVNMDVRNFKRTTSTTKKQQSPKVDALSPEQQTEICSNMKKVTESNDKTFLDSLELFDRIDRHRKQHEQTLQSTERVAVYEIIGLVTLYLVEYGILRYIIGKGNKRIL